MLTLPHSAADGHGPTRILTAQRAGVTSVPFFAIGTQGMAGAQPVQTFRNFIDAALKEA
ncbi:hypothetical protein [Aestuariimicrobium ganziense]|uniref:hypothetical protein n=1 Tax=Aestuariimicrobium ganziense TaxID=2773677 RepID=UPI001941AE81|nr:hypothetical protein [Aestuariimicrobium ganziense]